MPLYLGDKLISGRSKPIDAEPIENSLNLVTSGGVKKYVDDKVGTGGTISGSGIAIQPEEPSDTDVWIDLDDDETGALSIVTSFNGRDGEVVPEAGDYTAEMVGADPSGSAASALASAKAYADGIKPTKTSQLTNDSGFITEYTETDPTVPAWAKNETKPTYTYSEVGAAASSHAAQHASGGSDPITPAAIGAIPSATDARTFIPAGTDIKNFFTLATTTYGYYFHQAGSLCVNAPIDDAVTWWFFNHTPSGTFATTHNRTGRCWWGQAMNGNFIGWYELATTDYALNKTGDTMTGNLNITNSGTSTKLTEQVTSGGTAYVGTIIDGKYKYLTWLSTQAGTDSLYWSSNATGVHHEYQFLHTGNMNLITPAGIGAVNKAGDTMTGDLTIEKDNPKIVFKNTTKGNCGFFEAGTNRVLLASTTDDTNSVGRFLSFHNNNNASLRQAIQLTERTSSGDTSYDILHTGNTNQTALVATATTPTVNGQINWTYG